MPDRKSLILNDADIAQKIKRMAYQVVEDNYDEKEIYIVGIKKQGLKLAEKLSEEIQHIQSIKVHLHSAEIDKRNPLSKEVAYSLDISQVNDQVVIIVDDVANTGRTAFYALQPIMEALPRKVRVAVLVDRKHKMYPICSDYVGLSLSTTMQEHITVEMDSKKKDAVYLS